MLLYMILAGATKLYRKGFSRALPISFVIVAIIYIAQHGQTYMPLQWQHLFKQASAFAVVFIVPLYGALVIVLAQTHENVLEAVGSRFLSLFGCLISMLLVPMIVLVIG